MRILHVGPVKTARPKGVSASLCGLFDGLGVDGPSRSILGLAAALAESGVEVGVLPTKPFFESSWLKPDKIKYLEPYSGRKYNPFVGGRRWLRLIEEEFGRPDLVNFHDVYDLFSCGLAAQMYRRNWTYIVTPRGGLRHVAQQRDSFKKKIANPLFFKPYLRHAAIIHALAEGEAEEIREFDPALRTAIAPNGLFAEQIDACAKLPRLKEAGDSRRVVGFLGQMFVHIKGLDLLVAAIGKLQESGVGENLRFVLAGPESSKAQESRSLRDMVAALPRPSQVEFIGPRYGKDKWITLNNFDVFVLPSRTEGMPVVGLEAMACGRPCLFTKATNMAGVIEAARGGWGCETTVEGIYEGLMEVAEASDEALEALGEGARQYVRQHFTWSVVAERYLEMVSTVFNGDHSSTSGA